MVSLKARNDNIVFQPDPIQDTRKGIYLGSSNPNHRTGIVKSVGPETKWPLLKEGKRFLYVQRNCVECDGMQIVSEENILFQVAKDVVFSYEELTPENKIKVHLVNANETTKG